MNQMLNTQLLCSVMIDWDKIGRNSYLRGIPAINEVERIDFTHSPILLGLPGAKILSFDDGPLHPCSYEETDSYQVTSMFINNREQILRRLIDE